MDWQLKDGDALALLRELPDASVDAVITDPPYSSGGSFRGDRVTKTSDKYVGNDVARVYAEFSGDTRDQRAFAYWEALWIGECLRLSKPGAPILLFTDWRQLGATIDALQAGGAVFRGVVPWDKTEAVRPVLGRFRSQAEYVVWGSNGSMPVGGPALPGAYRIPVKQSDKHHMTGKPTELMRALVRICPVGGTVLDPFAGSGTTGVAALLEGRSFIGFEREAAYVEIARARLAAAEQTARAAAPAEPVESSAA